VIGNATQNGGLAAAFDGTTSQGWSASARKDPSSNITVGKDWGSGVTKKVARFKAWAPNNYTFGNAGTMKLQGSTDNFSSSIVDLWSGSYSATTAETKDISTGIDTSTAYRYHRLYCTGGSGGGAFAEIEFYKDVTSPSTNILTGSADISGQPSGTSMKYKIETLNTKEQKIHAVALQWS
jgi:hypothetical protein